MRQRRSDRSRMGVRLRCSQWSANDENDLGAKERKREAWNGDGGRALGDVKELYIRSGLVALH